MSIDPFRALKLRSVRSGASKSDNSRNELYFCTLAQSSHNKKKTKKKEREKAQFDAGPFHDLAT